MRFRPVFGIIVLCLCLGGCTSAPVKSGQTELRIALLGDTEPESPFVGWNDELPLIIARINTENPDLTVHLGNMIYGGYSQSGVREVDIRRQIALIGKDVDQLSRLLYPVAGDMDFLDGCDVLYMTEKGLPLNYSFNYGTVHFIVVNNALAGNRIPGDDSMAFLSRDLELNRDYPENVIFMHRSPLDRKGEPLDPVNFDAFTRILGGRHVLAVVCGADGQFHDINRGDVRFIGLPFERYNPYQNQSNNCQYYMMNLDAGGLTVAGRRVERK